MADDKKPFTALDAQAAARASQAKRAEGAKSVPATPPTEETLDSIRKAAEQGFTSVRLKGLSPSEQKGLQAAPYFFRVVKVASSTAKVTKRPGEPSAPPATEEVDVRW